MLTNKVFEVVLRKDLPTGMKIIDSSWAMKKKTNGVLRGQMNTRVFKQVEGQQTTTSWQSAHQSQTQQLLELC
jgi:hypothetical protein